MWQSMCAYLMSYSASCVNYLRTKVLKISSVEGRWRLPSADRDNQPRRKNKTLKASLR